MPEADQKAAQAFFDGELLKVQKAVKDELEKIPVPDAPTDS